MQVASSAFVTTRWNLILSGGDSEKTDEYQIRAALAELCRIYWRPIFFFVARRGYSPEDAEDSNSGFFSQDTERVIGFRRRILRGAVFVPYCSSPCKIF